MSHLMSDGGGEADGVVMVILEETQFIIKQPNASSADDSREFGVIAQT